MIKSWKHKGLKLFFESGNTSGIQAKHASRSRILLGVLDAAVLPQDINLPGFGFHRLRGDRKDYYTIRVSGNWRLTFLFEYENVILVNYEDYH